MDGGNRSASRAVLVIGLALAAAAGSAAAQEIDPRFPVTSGEVYRVLVAGDTLYASGVFHWIGKSNGSAVALDATTGAPVAPWPRIGYGPRGGDLVDTRYASVAVADGAGGVFVGGSFDDVSGVAREGLAHIRADGSLDAWSPAVNGSVGCMALGGSTLYVGGSFSSVGGVPRQSLAAVDVTTGAVLPWNPNPSRTSPGAWIRQVVVGGPNVYFAGDFVTVAGQPRTRLAAASRATGLPSAFAPQPDGVVSSLSFADSVLFAAGEFTSIGGQPRRYLAALDPGTGAAYGWDAAPDFPPTCVVASGRTVYLSGGFQHLNGVATTPTAAVDAVTAQPTGWRPDLGYGAAWQIVPAGPVVYLGGSFQQVGSQRRMFLAAVDSASGAPTPWNPGTTDIPSSLCITGSRVVVCGPLSGAGGLACSGLAGVNLATGEVLAWGPEFETQFPVAIASDGHRLYAGGSFDSIDGQPRRGLAAFERVSGQLTPWNPAGALQNNVGQLATDGTSVFAFGSLPSLGQPGNDRFAAADAVTGLPTPWAPKWSSASPYAAYLMGMLAQGGRVYIHGSIDSLNGLARRAIGAVDATTGALLPWNAQVVGGVVDVAAVDTTLYLAGGITSVGGQPRSYFAAVGAAGAGATGWIPDFYATGRTLAASPSAVTVVLNGHQWFWQGRYPRNTVIQFDPATGALRDWFPGIFEVNGYGIVADVATHGDDVIVCGAATMAGGDHYRPGLIRVRPDDGTPPAVAWLTPVAGESFVIGSQHALAWEASDDRAVASCDVWLSRSGPGGPWELLAAGVTGAASWDWRVSPPAAADCWLRVDARDDAGHVASALSPAAFSIAFTTDVPANGAPAALALHAPAPNPLRGAGTIGFTLPAPSRVRLSVLDVQGREVAVLEDGERAAGAHVARLPGGALPPGLYFVRLRAGSAELLRRIVVLR